MSVAPVPRRIRTLCMHANVVAGCRHISNSTVTRQVDRARAYARRNGWTVDDSCLFVDDGISGAEFAARPGFVQLMNALTACLGCALASGPRAARRCTPDLPAGQRWAVMGSSAARAEAKHRRRRGQRRPQAAIGNGLETGTGGPATAHGGEAVTLVEAIKER